MDVLKNKPICLMLALLSALVVLTAGTAIFASDESDADDPSAGVVYSEGIPVGTWTVSGTVLEIRSDNSTTVEEFDELRDYATSTSPSITSVTVKGFTSDSILTVLSNLSLDSDIVSYVGDIPTFTKKTDGSTDYVNGRAPGTWTYDVSAKTVTLTRGSSSDYRLIDYESANIRTIFYGFYFLDEAENAVINGTYKSGGNYIFHEFTTLKNFYSEDHTSMNAALLKDIGWETIRFDKLESFPSDCLNASATLTEVHFGNLTTLNSKAFQSCANLTTADISSTNTLTIGSYSFDGCSKLVNLTVNANTSVTLNEYCFRGCTTLRVATFNTASFTTGQYVFNGDTLLQEVFMGTGSVSVGNFAFKDCTNLTKANLDHLVQATAGAFMNTGIGGYVYDYVNQEYVVLPENEYLTMYYVNVLGSTWDATSTSNVTGAFQDCKNLKRIQFGEPSAEGGTGAMTKIGNKTFEGCKRLVTVDFNTPQMSGFLGARMFANCSSLETITGLSSSKFDTLGNEVFLGCNVLTSIELSDNLKKIANSAFSGLNSLVSVDAGTALQEIGSSAFLNCSSLTTFTHGNSLTKIGASAFKSTPLTVFAGGNSLETIGDSAFEACASLTTFTTGPALTTIGSKAFFGCQALTEFDAGDNSALTTIGTFAFDSCTSLTRVNLGNSLTTINQEAFDACTKLTTVSAGDKLEDIGTYAFRGCTKLTTFTCGNNLEFIRGSAFTGCTMLATFTGQFTPTPTSGAADRCSVMGSAFYECRALANIDLGDYTLAINGSAFQTCESLTEFNLGTALVTIGSSAFSGCTSLEHAGYKDGGWVMPDTLTTIGNSGFYRTALVSLAFGDNSQLTTINNYAFYGLSNLVGTDTVEGYAVNVIKFPDTLSKIDYQAFMNCSSLQGIYLSENSSIYYIGAQAFSGCDLHGTVTFTNHLTTLNYHAFYTNRNLERVVFSDSCGLTTIGYSCFNGCTRLAFVDLPNSLETIEHDAFRECALTTFIWSTGLKTIQYDAFRASGITTVDLLVAKTAR